MGKLDFLYDVAIEGGEQVLIDWGNSPQWVKLNEDLLASANRISLIPKNGQELPIVSVDLNSSKRWIIFSRVYRQVTSDKGARLYAIGWQQTVGGVNIKSLQWVYPNGLVENSDEPGFVDTVLMQ